MEVLKFAPLQSCVDVSFWAELAERKLGTWKLSEQPVPVRGFLGCSRYAETPGQLQLDATSFDAEDAGNRVDPQVARPGSHSIPGTLINTNTREAFVSQNKAELLQQAGARVWGDILSGAAERDPSLLHRFCVLAHADLKRYHFMYWFCFPALKPPAPFMAEPAAPLPAGLGQDLSSQVAAACDQWRAAGEGQQQHQEQGGAPPAWLLAVTDTGAITTAPLDQWAALRGSGATRRVLLAFADTSNLASYPGWPLRNLLLLAAVCWRVREVEVVCVRDSRGGADPQRSLLLRVSLPQVPPAWFGASTQPVLSGEVPALQGLKALAAEAAAAGAVVGIGGSGAAAAGAPEAVGWEANAEGKVAPRSVDLGPLMQPTQLAEQAVGLNLRLMRWRAAPGLNTEGVAAARCLLLGAGTLGCSVARTLLAWGVRHITFVDSGRVAFSNPVRQSLFNFEDCLEGGRPKAEAAAAALERIFPSVQASGRCLSIPMPGHPPATTDAEAAMLKDLDELDSLVASHDAVFLLTDTRESRWLPSLLAAAHGRIAITSALGFDSYVVMRNGGPPAGSDGSGASTSTASRPECGRLGCYFCNDVVAPVNSTIDRTLDQQCTVARPGLASIAGALAAELLATLLQHPLGVNAPTTLPTTAGSKGPGTGQAEAPALGAVPHMIRGQLTGFSQVVMEGRASSGCTACSPAVVSRYQQQGRDFVMEAIKDPVTLEHVTGLTELQAQAEALMGMSDDDDDDEEEEEEGQQEGGQKQGGTSHVLAAGNTVASEAEARAQAESGGGVPHLQPGSVAGGQAGGDDDEEEEEEWEEL